MHRDQGACSVDADCCHVSLFLSSPAWLPNPSQTLFSGSMYRHLHVCVVPALPSCLPNPLNLVFTRCRWHHSLPRASHVAAMVVMGLLRFVCVVSLLARPSPAKSSWHDGCLSNPEPAHPTRCGVLAGDGAHDAALPAPAAWGVVLACEYVPARNCCWISRCSVSRHARTHAPTARCSPSSPASAHPSQVAHAH